jgi:hypothetical protein
MPKMGVHTNGLPFIDDGSGHRRILACLKPTKKYSHFPHFSSAFPLMPKADWQEFEDDDSMIRILDQDGHGSCVGHGSCSGFEYAWTRRGGTSRIFSANYLYSLLNLGSDNGAVVGDAATALQQQGICLDATVPEAANIIFTRQMPPGAATEAQRFKAGTIYRITTFEEIATAVQMRLPVVVGIDCGQAFEPDANGVLPDQRGSGGGHCMFLRLGMKNIKGDWYAKDQNSWAATWGVKGCCWINDTYFGGEMGDHYVIAGPLEDPQDPTNVPTAGTN